MTYVKTTQIKISVTGSCVPNCFFLFYEKDWQGGVFKFMKNDHFLVHLAVLIFFPKFLGRLRSGLC